ncbi:MAG TPA: CDP-alcohol phosphatidyltransferase family protein [Candidatus Aenigmarchaeota archaeon]|nr:CDP-alcohol phosphatidyltransferase family protein [Candidatus Aenigmarchaeota archaeon]
MLYKKRYIFKGMERWVGKTFSNLPISPNMWSIIGLVFAILAAFLIYKHLLAYACIAIAISMVIDIVDGCVARYKNMVTKKGAYLDTIVDRYSEFFIILSMLWINMPSLLFPPAFWLLLLLLGSFMTTYAKCAAKEKELIKTELRGGLLERSERMVMLLIAIAVGIVSRLYMAYIIILLAILSNLTAFQRMSYAWKSE